MNLVDKPIFLFCMIDGSMLSIALRIKAEGYPVKVWISEKAKKSGKNQGKGLLDKDEFVKDYWQVIKEKKPNELIVIFDVTGLGDQADMLIKMGYHVIGDCSWADKAEFERDYGNELAEQMGLKVPPSFQFTSLSLARAFVQSQPDDCRYIFKANGEDFAGSSKTYVSKNKQDLLEYISWLVADTKEKHYHFDGFELQEFVDGEECDWSVYWDGEKFVKGSVNVYFEKKKAGDSEYKKGGVGQALGCAVSTSFFVEHSPYFDKYLSKLAPTLKESGYVGQISTNTIVSKKDGQPYFLEYSPRFGYDAIFGEMDLRQDAGMSIAEFFINLATKKPIKFPYGQIVVTSRIYCGTPGIDPKEVEGRYFSFEPGYEEDYWFLGVSKESDHYVVENNMVMVTTSSEATLTKATKRLYDGVIKNLNISDIYFRSQVAEGIPEKVRFLKEKGWL